MKRRVLVQSSCASRARGFTLVELMVALEDAFQTHLDEGAFSNARDVGQLRHPLAREALRTADQQARSVRERAKKLVSQTLPRGEPNDADYIFLDFIVRYFPRGLVGLLVAVILCAAMSATAAALNALGTSSVIDFYKRLLRPEAPDAHYVLAAKGFTVFWGLVAMAFAVFASQLDNLK